MPPQTLSAFGIYIPAPDDATSGQSLNDLPPASEQEAADPVWTSNENPASHTIPRRGRPSTMAQSNNSVGLGGARAYTRDQLREEVVQLKQRAAIPPASRHHYRRREPSPYRPDTPGGGGVRLPSRAQSPSPEVSTPPIRQMMREVGRMIRTAQSMDELDGELYPNLPRGMRRELELVLQNQPRIVQVLVDPERILAIWNNGDSLGIAQEHVDFVPYQLARELVAMEHVVRDQVTFAGNGQGNGRSTSFSLKANALLMKVSLVVRVLHVDGGADEYALHFPPSELVARG